LKPADRFTIDCDIEGMDIFVQQRFQVDAFTFRS
jgi:hypothetical protein